MAVLVVTFLAVLELARETLIEITPAGVLLRRFTSNCDRTLAARDGWITMDEISICTKRSAFSRRRC